MQLAITISGADYVAQFDARMTHAGHPATGPSWRSAGEPAQDPEYEVELRSLHEDLGAGRLGQSLELTDWLRDRIELTIHADGHAFSEILADYLHGQEGDPDEAHDRWSDASMEREMEHANDDWE